MIHTLHTPRRWIHTSFPITKTSRLRHQSSVPGCPQCCRRPDVAGAYGLPAPRRCQRLWTGSAGLNAWSSSTERIRSHLPLFLFYREKSLLLVGRSAWFWLEFVHQRSCWCCCLMAKLCASACRSAATSSTSRRC